MNIKDAKKPARILNVATKLIVKQGTINISTTQIAKKMGIAQSNIYLYYANKQAILQAVYLQAVGALSDYATQNIDTSAPLLEQIEHFIRVLYEFAQKNSQAMAVIEIFKHSPDLQLDLSAEQKSDANQQIQAALQKSADEGILRTTNIVMPRTMIFETMYFYAAAIQNGTLHPNDPDIETVVEMILAAILNPAVNAARLAKQNS